jgi:dienelactone hydrolase
VELVEESSHNPKAPVSPKSTLLPSLNTMSCCPVTAEPALGAAASVGSIKTFGQTSIYVAGPATAKAGILAFPDIYGLDSGRTKADADALGKLGYAVVVIDLAAGEYLTDETFKTSFMEWVKKNSFEALLPRINDAIAYLKTEAKVETFASYGYCWGSWIGATFTASATPTVSGHVSFHPTWMLENAINGDGALDKLAENVKVPQFLLAAGDDAPAVQEGGSVEKILKARADVGALSNVINFPDQNHGWVHRGDLSNEATKEAVKKAWHTAIKFIQTVNPPQ